jgi:hypothetical protein
VTRTNFATNPSAATAVTNFAAVPGTGGTAACAYNSGAGYAGNGFARTTWSVATTAVSGGVSYTQTGLAAATQYACQMWVRSSKTQSVALTAAFQTSGAVMVNTVVGATVALSANAWAQVTVIGTSGAAVDRVVVTAQAATGGVLWASADIFDADAVLVEAAATIGTYFDGSTNPLGNRKYAWTGTANASTSVDSPIVTVSSQPANMPPRNEVSMAINAGDVMSTATLTRIVGGISAPTRTQPSTGFDTQVVEDYETPYGVPVTYEFVSDYINPAAVTTVWDEVWANLTAWTATGDPFTVSSGQVHFASGNGTLTRSVTSGSYRVTIATIVSTVASSDSAECYVGFGTELQIGAISGGTVWVAMNGGNQITTAISPSSPITVDFLGTSIVISGSGGSYTFASLTSTNFSSVVVSAQALQYGSFSVGEVKVSSYPVTSHTDATSDAATNTPASPWMIHPSNPSLSIPVGSADRSTASIRAIGDVTNPSASTEHQILGQSAPITTTSGPRLSNRLTVVIAVKTSVQEQALNGLLADGTPLLFRFPPSFNAGFDEGFYSVGDVTRARFAQRVGAPRRDITLPLTAVQSPIVSVQNAGWSWAALAAAFPTWSQVSAAYATWADVLTNNRRPGF